MYTIDGIIRKYNRIIDKIDKNADVDAMNHLKYEMLQIIDWLEELKELRKNSQNQFNKCATCKFDALFLKYATEADDIKSYEKKKNNNVIKSCKDCRYGLYNDWWNTFFCYCEEKCTDFDHWEKREEKEEKEES